MKEIYIKMCEENEFNSDHLTDEQWDELYYQFLRETINT